MGGEAVHGLTQFSDLLQQEFEERYLLSGAFRWYL